LPTGEAVLPNIFQNDSNSIRQPVRLNVIDWAGPVLAAPAERLAMPSHSPLLNPALTLHSPSAPAAAGWLFWLLQPLLQPSQTRPAEQAEKSRSTRGAGALPNRPLEGSSHVIRSSFVPFL